MMMFVPQLLLGGLFALAVVAKLIDSGGVRRAVIAFGVPDVLAAPVGWTLLAAELTTTVLLLLTPTARTGGVAALILLAGFTAAVLVNLARGRRLQCHCFGRLSSGPLGWSTAARNGCFAAVAAFIATGGRYGWSFPALAVLMLGLWVGPASYRRWKVRAGADASGFALADASGRTWTLDDLVDRRHPLVLVFSHPGCGACAALAPEVAQWQHDLAGRVNVVNVSSGRERNGSAERGPTTLVDESRATFAAYGITATPSAVLIDGDRKRVAAPSRGAGAIRTLVDQAAAATERPRFSRRRLGRTSLGLASFTVLPTVAAAAAACGSDSKKNTSRNVDALEVDGAWLCNQTFALCTTAPCVPSKTDPEILVCDCVMQNGYSIGFKPCNERALSGNTVRSDFSTMNVNANFGVLSCPSGVVWANCLDVECELDPNNPAVAHCQCVAVRTGESLTFGGGCNTATCGSTIWSAATADLPGSAQYKKGMAQLGRPLEFPKTCPAPP
jgi:thiol-disulfide isomerase/thioredoxin